MNLVKQMQMADSKTFNSYEYAIESISSSFLGETKKEEMLKVIQKYTNDGWRCNLSYREGAIGYELLRRLACKIWKG